MADRPPAENWGAEAEVLEIRVTALADGKRRTPVEWIRSFHFRLRTRVLVAVVAVLAAVVVVLGAAFAGHEHHTANGARPRASGAGAAGVAETYGYPQRCLAVTILAEDPDYARADFDRSEQCGRYTGYATAILHRVDGVWRFLLDAAVYACPVRAIPARVQALLGVCEPARGSGRSSGSAGSRVHSLCVRAKEVPLDPCDVGFRPHNRTLEIGRA